MSPPNPDPRINAEQRRGSETERPPVRLKGRTRQRYSLHAGGPSDACERNELATKDKGHAADRLHPPGLALVQRPGTAPPVPAAARPAEPAGRRVYVHG